MQAKLPDINAAIVRYRNNFLHAFDNGEPDTVIVSLSAINSLLPEEYKVEINTAKYNQLVAENKIIVCPSCETKSEYQTIKFLDVLLAPISSMITNKKYEKIWICPSCKNEVIFSAKQIRIVKFQQPYYLGVIPDPPVRQNGISDRSTFNVLFRKWFALALDELESKIGKYRADYIAQLEADDIKLVDEDHTT